MPDVLREIIERHRPMDLNIKTVRETLHEIMKLHRLTVSGLALHLGIDRTTLHRWLAGREHPGGESFTRPEHPGRERLVRLALLGLDAALSARHNETEE